MKMKKNRIISFELEAGEILGDRYRVTELLGRGWEGEVYKVKERVTGIERAAKLIFPHRDSRGKALLSYARKLNKLKDVPVITQYHHMDTTEIEGREIQFLVSEYVDGEQLSGLLNSQPGKRFSSFEALHILHAISSAVAPIHQRGEYHGDLHTDNIIIRRKGLGFQIKLLDFFDFGRPSRAKIENDVLLLVDILWELVGGARWYGRTEPEIKRIVCGRKSTLILRKFQTAGQLTNFLNNLHWS